MASHLGHVVQRDMLTYMPTEMLYGILDLMSYKDKLNLSETNRRLHEIVQRYNAHSSISRFNKRMREKAAVLSQRTGTYVEPLEITKALVDEEFQKLGIARTEKTYTRFIDALYFLNNEESISADGVLQSEGPRDPPVGIASLDNLVHRYFTKGDRRYRTQRDTSECYQLRTPEGNYIFFRPEGPTRIMWRAENQKFMETYVVDGVNDCRRILYSQNLPHYDIYLDPMEMLHREGGLPASTFWHEGTKQLHIQEYRVHGIRDRAHNMPSVIEWWPNGNRKKEAYYVNDILHCSTDRPCVLEWHPQGQLKTKKYYHNNLPHRGNGEPAEIRCWANGELMQERWIEHGIEHRPGDNPSKIVYDNSGNIVKAEYRKNGVLDNGDNPAVIYYYMSASFPGKVHKKKWYSNGLLHRDNDEPAEEIYNKDGFLSTLSYYREGQRSRYITFFPTGNTSVDTRFVNNLTSSSNDEPAEIVYHPNKQCHYRRWYHNGFLSRGGDKPAVERYSIDGVLVSESYYRNGVAHRDGDNPALIVYKDDPDDHRILEKYYISDGLWSRNGDNPAVIRYFASGEPLRKRYEEFLLNGYYHRTNNINNKPQPAISTYAEDGKVLQCSYYFEGVPFIVM